MQPPSGVVARLRSPALHEQPVLPKADQATIDLLTDYFDAMESKDAHPRTARHAREPLRVFCTDKIGMAVTRAGTAAFTAAQLIEEPFHNAAPAISNRSEHVGQTDGLAPFRPVPTFPADHPVEEIDHVLVLGGLRVTDVRVGTTMGSDHAPVSVRLQG